MIQQLTRQFNFFAFLALMFFLGNGLVSAGQSDNRPQIYRTQLPFSPPPQPDYEPGEDATPAPENLTEQEWFSTIPSAFWKLYPYGISSEDYFRLAKEVLDKTNKPL